MQNALKCCRLTQVCCHPETLSGLFAGPAAGLQQHDARHHRPSKSTRSYEVGFLGPSTSSAAPIVLPCRPSRIEATDPVFHLHANILITASGASCCACLLTLGACMHMCVCRTAPPMSFIWDKFYRQRGRAAPPRAARHDRPSQRRSLQAVRRCLAPHMCSIRLLSVHAWPCSSALQAWFSASSVHERYFCSMHATSMQCVRIILT